MREPPPGGTRDSVRKNMKTPQRAIVLWIASNIGLLAAAPLYAVWLTRILREETATAGAVYSPAGDTPTVAVAGVTALVLCALPVLNLALYWILRQYPGKVNVAQAPDFHGRRLVLEMVYGIIVAALVFAFVDSLRFGDWEFAALSCYWIALVLNFRAISLAKAGSHSSTARLPPDVKFR